MNSLGQMFRLNSEYEIDFFSILVECHKHSKKKICTKSKKFKTDKYAIDLASGNGASNWLNALPLSRYNFNQIKPEFRDGFYLRYGWEWTKMVEKAFTVEILTKLSPCNG